jgi:very-short-patch-repair endonuclease
VHLAIPVTVPARTLLDLATILESQLLRRAVRRAQGLGRVTLGQIGWMLERHRGRRGCAALRKAIASGAAPTKSERESDVLDVILRGGLVHPEVNKPLTLGGRRVIPDFRWPAQRLILEVDSTAWHENPLARADDRKRQAVLEAHGETVLRVHWRDAVLAPAAFVAGLRAAGTPRSAERRLACDSR